MSPPTAQRRPLAGAAKVVQADEATADAIPGPRDNPPRHAVSAALRRRADAAHRLEPVDGRWGERLAARDPALPWPPAPRSPSTYGMTPDEIRWHAADLMASGWQRYEIAAVLAPPGLVAA